MQLEYSYHTPSYRKSEQIIEVLKASKTYACTRSMWHTLYIYTVHVYPISPRVYALVICVSACCWNDMYISHTHVHCLPPVIA